MPNEILLLAGTAATLGFIHTLLGPDHYLPFIVMAKARQWSIYKTALITILCGIGHVLSSIILGFIGIALGIAVFQLKGIESSRGDLAAWLLILFGFAYFIWGIHRAIRNRPHEHIHLHEDGNEHVHLHNHTEEHSHVHTSKPTNITPWILFTIFVFGPCEPLIPIIMYPAAKHNILGVVIVSTIFGLITISTMLFIVLSSCYGLSKIRVPSIERYAHALAGLTIFICGGAIKFLGL